MKRVNSCKKRITWNSAGKLPCTRPFQSPVACSMKIGKTSGGLERLGTRLENPWNSTRKRVHGIGDRHHPRLTTGSHGYLPVMAVYDSGSDDGNYQSKNDKQRCSTDDSANVNGTGFI